MGSSVTDTLWILRLGGGLLFGLLYLLMIDVRSMVLYNSIIYRLCGFGLHEHVPRSQTMRIIFSITSILLHPSCPPKNHSISLHNLLARPRLPRHHVLLNLLIRPRKRRIQKGPQIKPVIVRAVRFGVVAGRERRHFMPVDTVVVEESSRLFVDLAGRETIGPDV